MGVNRLGKFDPSLRDGYPSKESTLPYHFSQIKIEGSLDLLFKTY